MMIGETTRMRKSLSIIASAAMAISLFASAALADTVKTTSDYQDLAAIDAGLKAKIDTLLSKGIFEGVSANTFGISQNMTRAQFAKVASLIFDLKVDTTTQTSSFSDVQASDSANGWAIPYIEAAKKAGLIDGMTDSTFAPGDNVTIGQLDTVLVKGLGKTINVATSPWYDDAVKQAKDLGVHPIDKAGDTVATRADLVVGAFASSQAYQQLPQKSQVSVASVQASGDQAVQVTLDSQVDTSKATLSLIKDTTVIPTATEWSSDKKSAKLTLTGDTKLSAGNYSVILGGLDASAIKTASGSLTITSSTTSTAGNTNYSITDSYDLANVLDSGLTDSASGIDGFATKAEAIDPTVSKFAKEIEVTATNSAGDSVALPGIIQTIASSNPAVVKVGVSLDNKGYILGNKAGTATINFVYKTINGESKQMSINVNVKSTPVQAEQIKAVDSIYNQYLTVTNGVYSGSFNAYTAMDLTIVDNYGIEYKKTEIQKYNFALASTLIAEDITSDSNNGPVGTVTIDSDGTVHVTGNVTGFQLTASLSNGEKAFTWINVIKN
jgi:hypothetical protein